jgi:hypothetical protein
MPCGLEKANLKHARSSFPEFPVTLFLSQRLLKSTSLTRASIRFGQDVRLF